MNKHIYLLSIFSMIGIIACKAQIVNIPDPVFKAKLLTHNPIIDTNGDGEVQLSEAQSLDFLLNISNTPVDTDFIFDLTGIEAFVNVQYISCNFHKMSSIDITQNTALLGVNLFMNELTTFDISQNPDLEYFTLGGSTLTEMDVSQNPNLTGIQIHETNISTINTSNNPNLNLLNLKNSGITSIDIENNAYLEKLYLSNTTITNVDLSILQFLKRLEYAHATITQLDISDNAILTLLDLKNCGQLIYGNLKNGNNENFNLTYYEDNFTNLPQLETVCVDEENSTLANFIENQLGHPITITANCILGDNDISLNDVVLYPNPTNNIVHLETLNPIISIEICNVTGSLLYRKIEMNIKSIELENFATGVYFLRIKTANGSETVKKIIRE